MLRVATLSIVVGLALGCFACAEVPAHARGRLAHPTMAPESAHSLAADHLHDLHEGAAGGDRSVSSGCGCN